MLDQLPHLLCLLILATPAFLFSPSCVCCFGPECSDCSIPAQTPAQVRATLASFSDDTCSAGSFRCDDFNGTWDCVSFVACQWQFSILSLLCNEGSLGAGITVTQAVDGFLRGSVFGGFSTATWESQHETNASGHDDCHSWSLFDIPHLSTTGDLCVEGTFKVTTL